MILSTTFWVLAMVYLFGLVKDILPVIAQCGLFFSIFGFISGGLFGFVGVMTEIFNIPHDTYIDAFEKYPISSGILLFWSGPLAPLSLIVLGILFWKTRKTKSWIAIMMIIGGLAFPASRISRNEWLAHVADLFLLVPLMYLGIQMLISRR